MAGAKIKLVRQEASRLELRVSRILRLPAISMAASMRLPYLTPFYLWKTLRPSWTMDYGKYLE